MKYEYVKADEWKPIKKGFHSVINRSGDPDIAFWNGRQWTPRIKGWYKPARQVVSGL